MSTPSTPIDDVDALIVGAGPAGLTAAATLVEHGVPVTVVDDNEQGGGQYFRQLPPGFRERPGSALHRDQPRAAAALGVLSHPLVRYMPSTTLWTQSGEREFSYAGIEQTGRLRARQVILATGAHDRPQPFPGWTLPGVISAGGCLNLIKGQALVPGRRVVVVGNGPLLLVAAYSLLKAGVQVLAVAEAADTAAMLRQTPSLLQVPSLLALGLKYRARLLAAGTRFLSGYAVVEALGDGCVQRVTLAPLGHDGQVLGRDRRVYDVDALVSGYGLTPSSEFARMMGLAMCFDPLLGGWVPERGDDLATSMAGVYGAGDGCGIGGVELATAEGRHAALSVAARLGKDVGAAFESSARRLARLNRFRRALSAGYRLPAPLHLARPETTVCRCENVSEARVAAAARTFDGDLWRIKSATRLSMGSCQGRNCLSSCAAIVARECGVALDTLPPPRMRSPARPIAIASLLGETLGPAREPDVDDGAPPGAGEPSVRPLPLSLWS